ncbi:uncharacterized protein [Aegilops tauschii subsp. strangulata]|uniref:uncharacterized protein n=1 Tax=Aegilops tauschii subsp. strangulata TaxID=200361 RepID=UPI003CC8B1C7
MAYTDCRGERPGNQRQCQKCEHADGIDVRNTAMDAVLSSYNKVLQLQVLVSEPRRLLFAEEDHTFFMVGGVLDIGAPITVSVVCIRAGASPPPHYTAKVWANEPPGEPKGKADAVKVEIEVTSSMELDAVVVRELTFFTVWPKLLAGAGLSRTVSLHMQVDKLTS